MPSNHSKLKIFLLVLVLFVIVEILAGIGYKVYLSVFPARPTNPIVVSLPVTNSETSTNDLVTPPLQTNTPFISEYCKTEDIYTDLGEAIKNQNKVCGLNLIGKMPETFDPRIFRMTQIKVLRLGTNNLKVLPAELFTLASLVQLGLAGNGLTTIPADIAKLTNLKIINLSSNELVSLPVEIGNLTELTDLDLSNNKLTALPQGIVLKKLKNLYLTGNNFSDAEKEKIQQLAPLAKIDF